MSRLSGALVLLLALAGCATTDEQRFPLDYAAGQQAAYQVETAREALPAYLRMGADLERRGQFKEAALAYNNAVVSARALGRLQDALDASQKAVEMAERSGSTQHLSIALSLLGWTHVSLGAFEKALPVFERGAQVARRAGDFLVEARCHHGLGAVYRRLGNPEKALEHSRKSVETQASAIQVKTVDWARFGIQGQRWLASLERAYAVALIGMGWNHLVLRQWEPARLAFQKALEVATRIQVRHLIGQAHQGLGGVAARQRDWQAAVSHLEEAIRLNPQPGFVAATQGWLGGVYRATGKLPEAETALRQAVAGIEDLRSLLQSEELRESFFEDKVGTYENLILCLLARGKGPEAFDISERARARAFLDLLGNRVALSRGRSESLIAEERTLRERINALKAMPEDSPALRRELELAREAYQAFLQRVRRLDREQASLMTVEPLTLREVQALLPKGTVLLEYFVTGQERTILWTVERSGVAVVTLPLGRRRVTERVQAFRELIASRERQPEMQRMARALFDELVRPGLKGRAPKELLLVPHDALHYLPFQALMPTPRRYLLQEVALHYYSSASLMQFTRAKGQAGAPTFFALGNPDFQDPTLSLRYAGREAQGIAALFPETALVTGKAATKAASRDEIRRHSVLHFATHAEFDETDPLGSSLLLAGTPGEESRLEVQEIFGLNLHASLVVLSACETALGKLTRGDELTGLTRAFIYAGTPSVITTLWQVNDRAAYELMRDFYDHLKAGEDKAESLRQAQLAMLERRPHPYYWAAYQLIGEAQ
jgi:CHAT domain-containing protein/Flp pilus assembly protein TadD